MKECPSCEHDFEEYKDVDEWELCPFCGAFLK